VAIDLTATNASLYAVLKSDAAGAGVRAATGPGTAAGVIPAHLLKQPRPARPLVVWRGGVVGGESDQLRSVNGTWWVYDDPEQGSVRINTIISLIESAYPPDAIASGRTTVTGIGQEIEDISLGLLARAITLTYRRLTT
jgi:hypothetical protein